MSDWMEGIDVDDLATASPMDSYAGRYELRDDEVNEIAVCLQCVLPACNDKHPDCIAGRASRVNCSNTATVKQRRREADRWGDKILRLLRGQFRAGATATQLALALRATKDQVHVALAGLCIDRGEPITPAGMRDDAVIHRLSD